ncbi:MAG: hypothetical protein J6A98_02175 [Clostridia bacterium]|nr:hypothetical protein [Clostridia bacterium]
MRKKSLAISNIVMLVAAVFCVAIFGAGAVWAYNANLAMKFQATFSFNALTLNLNGAKIYENGEIQDSNFTIIPVAENTLEISAEYQNFGQNITSFQFTISQTYSMTLEKFVAYDVVLVDKLNINTNCVSCTNGTTITIVFVENDDVYMVEPDDDDILTFQIKFS